MYTLHNKISFSFIYKWWHKCALNILLVITQGLRFIQHLRTVFGYFCCQKLNWNRAYRGIYGWKDIPLGSKFWHSIQWISPWNMNKIETLFFPRVQKKILFRKTQRWSCVKQHCVNLHKYIYQICVFIFRLLVRIQDNQPIKLAVEGDNIGTSWLLILVLLPHKYNSSVVLCSN